MFKEKRTKGKNMLPEAMNLFSSLKISFSNLYPNLPNYSGLYSHAQISFGSFDLNRQVIVTDLLCNMSAQKHTQKQSSLFLGETTFTRIMENLYSLWDISSVWALLGLNLSFVYVKKS